MATVQQFQLSFLSDARLARCPDEFQQMSESWSALLKPFVRDQSAT